VVHGRGGISYKAAGTVTQKRMARDKSWVEYPQKERNSGPGSVGGKKELSQVLKTVAGNWGDNPIQKGPEGKRLSWSMKKKKKFNYCRRFNVSRKGRGANEQCRQREQPGNERQEKKTPDQAPQPAHPTPTATKGAPAPTAQTPPQPARIPEKKHKPGEPKEPPRARGRI